MELTNCSLHNSIVNIQSLYNSVIDIKQNSKKIL